MTKAFSRKSRSKVPIPGVKDGRASAAPRDYHDRRPLRFWQPFNDWWRSELERMGRRPTAAEIMGWYEANAFTVWKDDAPTLQETRVHAKCLRSLPLVRDYFRNYRAKKRSNGERTHGRTSGEDYEWATDKEDEEDEDDYKDVDFEAVRAHASGRRREEVDEEEEEPEDTAEGTNGDGDEGDEPYTNGFGMGGAGSHHELGAAAALNQLVALRSGTGSGAPGGLPLDLLQSLPPLVGPAAAAALLSNGQGPGVGVGLPPSGVGLAGMGLAGIEPGQPHDLLQSLAVQQLQHAAAVQQQLALAALAQNLALSHATGIGIQALTQQAAVAAAATAQQNALLSVLGGGEPGAEAAGLMDQAAAERGRPGWGGRHAATGSPAVERDLPGGEGLLEPGRSGAALGRGKRRRVEREPDSDLEVDRAVAAKAEVDEMEEMGVDGTGLMELMQPSGRGMAAAVTAAAAAAGVRRGGGSGGSAGGRRRGSRGGSATAAAGTSRPQSKRQEQGIIEGPAPGAGPAALPEMMSYEDPAVDVEGALTLALAPPQLVDLPAALSLEPLPRHVLMTLGREQLVERVLLLQAHLHLLMQQQLQRHQMQQLKQQHALNACTPEAREEEDRRVSPLAPPRQRPREQSRYRTLAGRPSVGLEEIEAEEGVETGQGPRGSRLVSDWGADDGNGKEQEETVKEGQEATRGPRSCGSVAEAQQQQQPKEQRQQRPKEQQQQPRQCAATMRDVDGGGGGGEGDGEAEAAVDESRKEGDTLDGGDGSPGQAPQAELEKKVEEDAGRA